MADKLLDKVKEYAAELEAAGRSPGYAYATAWARACKYHGELDEQAHCRRPGREYLTRKTNRRILGHLHRRCKNLPDAGYVMYWAARKAGVTTEGVVHKGHLVLLYGGEAFAPSLNAPEAIETAVAEGTPYTAAKPAAAIAAMADRVVGVERRSNPASFDEKLTELEAKIAKAEGRMQANRELAEDSDYLEMLEAWRKQANALRQLVESIKHRQTPEQRLADARAYAEEFIASVKRHKGPENLVVWQREGVGTRVYFPGNLGFVNVSSDGGITTMLRGKQTLSTTDLYPQWKKALKAAIDEPSAVKASREEGVENPAPEHQLSPTQRRKYLGKLEGAQRQARAAEIVERRKPSNRSNAPFATDAGQVTRRSSHARSFEQVYGRAPADVADAARLTGIPEAVLEQVYARGMAAWQTGHRPGASQHAWALARVQSFATGGPTALGPDADLAAKVQNPAGQTETPEFKRWFGDSKVVDKKGKPLVVYRGVRSDDPSALNAEPRAGYAVFASTSPYVAASYVEHEPSSWMPNKHKWQGGSILPLYVKADTLIEFPVTTDRSGSRYFDKLAFDEQARRLRPGEVLVARQVYDTGPYLSGKYDPELLATYASDVYAWNKGTSVKSATANKGTFSRTDPDIRNPAPAAAADQTKTAAFKRWFGKSKVVDKDGKPLAVYHGTNRKIHVFDPNVGINAPVPKSVYFSDDPNIASWVAKNRGSWEEGGKVIAAYLRIENPLVIDANGAHAIHLTDQVASLLRRDHDGVIIKNVREFFGDEWTTTFAVFSPTQIKSATGNRGTFDPHDPDIRNPAGQTFNPRQPAQVQNPTVQEFSAIAERVARDVPVSKAKQYGEDVRALIAELRSLRAAKLTPLELLDATNSARAKIKKLRQEGDTLLHKLADMRPPQTDTMYWWVQADINVLRQAVPFNADLRDIEDMALFLAEKITGRVLAYAQEAQREVVKRQLERERTGGKVQNPNSQTETPAFKKWFGDSVVIDGDGKPLVVFHGTKGNFTQFSPAMVGTSDFGSLGRGYYFSEYRDLAEFYAKMCPGDGTPRVLSVYLSIQNPISYEELPHVTTIERSKAITKGLIDAGYDGVIKRDQDGRIVEVVAFYPTQIKSATSNRGTFDRQDADIRNPTKSSRHSRR